MSTLLDKLNLRPQERRLVVMSVAVLAVVLHFWFVQPYFSEWSRNKDALEKAGHTATRYQAEITRTAEYQAKLGKLEGEGTGVLARDQASDNLLISRIQTQAAQSKVNFSRINPLPMSASSKTNVFFEEHTIDFGVNPTGDKELIDFLVAVGNSDLMIRVKELALNPDANHYKLTGSMKLVASFQKKGPAGAAQPAKLSSAKP